MHRSENYEVLLEKSLECEMLARVVMDVSIRKKCAELAVEYRALANQARQSDHIEAYAE